MRPSTNQDPLQIVTCNKEPEISLKNSFSQPLNINTDPVSLPLLLQERSEPSSIYKASLIKFSRNWSFNESIINLKEEMKIASKMNLEPKLKVNSINKINEHGQQKSQNVNINNKLKGKL